MKKAKLLRTIISVCLALLCMVQTTFAVVPETASPQLLNANEILDAVSPLIEEEAKHYNIRNISVTGESSTVKNDGTVDTICNIVMDMCLKAQSVEELPYAAGMLSELGVNSVEECYAAAANASLNATAQSANQESLLAAQVIPQLSGIAESIGNDITLTFTVIINTDPDRTVNQVLGCGDTDSNGSMVTFPLEAYFPESDEDLFAQGANAVSEMRGNISTTNAVVLPPDLDTGIVYFRNRARDYAKKYSSEAPASKKCEHGNSYIDQSYYNSAYTINCHVDCANFVSQAIHAGGIPTDSLWYPQSYAWVNVGGLRNYFYSTKHYWYVSNYEECTAGNIIINVNAENVRYHVNMCVLNDTVNHAYAAHNADHCNKSYSRTYWGSAKVEYYKFYITNPV